MKQQLDVENWNRKEHFCSLNSLKNPFWCNSHNRLHQSLRYKEIQTSFFFTTNVRNGKSYRCFKCIAEDNVYVYDQITSATIGRADGTFGFPIEYNPDYVVLKKQ
jgi:hypothetical protein